MAICQDCNREMLVAASCDVRAIVWHGVRYDLAPHRPSRYAHDRTARCHDCGARPGGYHHLGCDMQRCPRCRGQFISCGCWDEADEADEGDEDEDR